MKPKQFFFITALLFSITSFTQPSVEVLYKNYQINRSIKEDSSMITMLQSYTDSVNKYMNTVIGFCNTSLYKKQPESTLGNLMAEAVKTYATKAFNTNVDAAFINYGSMRSYLSKGEIKLQNVYDLASYDNFIVLQKINGNILHQLLDLIAYKGGYPCSGVSMKIKNKKATDIFINNTSLHDTAVYTIAILDYLANGGEGCTMLKNIAQQNKNVLYRNALIDYIKSFTNAGKPVTANIENRIVIADE